MLSAVQDVNPEIEFAFIVEQGEGGGGASVDIKSKPDSMTDEEIFQLIYEASEFELALDVIFEVSP